MGMETWELTKKILPILIAGTFVVGVIAYFIPAESFRPYLGGNSLPSTFLASIIGVLLYMPTLLEVPIIGTTFGYSTGVMGRTCPGPAADRPIPQSAFHDRTVPAHGGEEDGGVHPAGGDLLHDRLVRLRADLRVMPWTIMSCALQNRRPIWSGRCESTGREQGRFGWMLS